MASLEVADVFRQFAPSYLDAFGADLLPSHRRAIEDILACRTATMGGQVHQCRDCGEHFFSYHGCRNRSCPACHREQTQQWLDARTTELLPCTYYHVTVTVPAQLRALFRSNQRECYALLMKAAAEAVLTLCRDKKYMGAMPAILAVLHTWTAAMDYHPHVHLLVSGGGIGEDGKSWCEAKRSFLIPVRALSKCVRATFQTLLTQQRPDLAAQVPDKVWNRDWVAWCKPWGQGETAVLDYLARYVHRIAITNNRILAMDEQTVTFRYKDRKSGQWRTCTVTGHEFMRRFLQHVLPRGFHKIRYYGLWYPRRRPLLENARTLLLLTRPQALPAPPATETTDPDTDPSEVAAPVCPYCGSHNTHCLGELPRLRTHRWRHPPRASPVSAP